MNNPYGFYTLLRKEVHRFASIWTQSLLAPVLTTLIYFLIFGYSLGDRLATVSGVRYIAFLTPGLVMFGVINNSFINGSFSLFLSRINGSVVDLLVAPLSTAQLVGGFLLASALRGIMVGVLIWTVAAVFHITGLAHPLYVVSFLVLTALMFASFGLIVAVFATKFDHLNFFPTFLITPLSFLGGVFYSIQSLPEPWRSVSLANPVLYLVNGLRYGFVGVSDVDPAAALAVTFASTLAVMGVTYWIFQRGYRLRE